jgi:hypothetical protein
VPPGPEHPHRARHRLHVRAEPALRTLSGGICF